ncbi:hypothetical protein [Rhodopirellula sp. MGV]|uniref:hypothetical protein n=1 Tax=Rhodopirellula sp. MGV TaxID=2023130 RepID=UPI00117A452A|nr:hypothetical protein [Rhodopirellula sp. MGV]
MKRSLFVWPLSAATLVISIGGVTLQKDAFIKALARRANGLWLSLAHPDGEISLPTMGQIEIREPDSFVVAEIPAKVVKHDTVNTLPSVTIKAPAFTKPETSVTAAKPVAPKLSNSLATIESWLDAPINIQQPAIIGIPADAVQSPTLPAPSLNSQSDLFGFDPVMETVSNRTPAPSADAPVIDLDPDLLDRTAGASVLEKSELSGNEELQLPLVGQADTPRVDLVPPRLAERPTTSELSDQRNESTGASPTRIAKESRSQSPLSAELQSDLSAQMIPSLNDSQGMQRIDLADETPAVADLSEDDKTRPLAEARSKAWPVATKLLEQLDQLDRVVAMQPRENLIASTGVPVGPEMVLSSDDLLQWSASVRDVLQQLPQAKRLGDEQVLHMLNQLYQSCSYAFSHAEAIQSRSEQVAWLQAAFSIQRRLAVWGPIYQINSGDFPQTQYVGDDLIGAVAAIENLKQSLPETGDIEGWNQFLLLGELEQAFTNGTDGERQELSQKFLSRTQWPNLEDSHRHWLSGDAVQSVAKAIRPWATGPIDYSAFLHQIEKAESNAIDLVTAEVAQSMQALRYARHSSVQRLADNIDVFYRNANVRMSISDEMLNQLLPEVPSRNVPVRTTMLGSRVTGVSTIESQLGLRLRPAVGSWEIDLQTDGSVATRSVGMRGPAAVRTSSNNPFSASTAISIKPSNIELGAVDVSVGGTSRLRGIHTDYDGWPLVGSLVRTFAEMEYLEKASLSNRIARQRIQDQIGDEISDTVREKVDQSSDRFSESVFGPLTRLQLQPKVVDMQSTDSRLIARYRMAGDWQLAAMTPRPRALADSLMSLQIHQSALNNTLEQLVPQNEVMPIRDVLTQCFDLLGMGDKTVPDDIPEEIRIQFAKHRPITVEIEDGKVWVTMRIIRLEDDDHLKLRNFIVRASYVPQINGLDTALVRDGHLSISGPGMSMRTRFPVRAVFNKVLAPSRPLQLTSGDLLQDRVSEDTKITQFELRDGWIGMSIGHMEEQQSVAGRPRGIR